MTLPPRSLRLYPLLAWTVAALALAGCQAIPLSLLPPLVLDRAPIVAPERLGRPTPAQRYAGVTVAALRARSYGAGDFRVVEDWGEDIGFRRSLIAYDSDGLTIYGFMDVPEGAGPFPVVIVNHGYVDPARYATLTYTTHYADTLAQAGYLTIHPNLRGYPPSDDGPNPLRAGFAVDVLNLLALVQRLGGEPGPLAAADPARIGLWGHSMGGGITLRVLTVSTAVDAAVLYGSMSGDEARNHARIRYFTGGARGLWEEDEAPDDRTLRQVSPSYYVTDIAAPISIHHGELDDQVTLAWSSQLCADLQALGKPVECFTYPGQPHTFVGEGDRLFIQRVVEFFDRTLAAE
jgi:dipeptidyl aminopeptidase/acylaminoacyl peptidase